MSDTTTLYEKCPHDRLEAHGGCTCTTFLGKKGKWNSDPEGVSAWWDDCTHNKWCPGGRERTFRWRQHYWYEGTGENGDVSGWRVPVTEDEVFWVEVSGEDR